MHSYIGIHHFLPKTHYQPLEDLIPLIDQTLADQNAGEIIDENLYPHFKENILQCMKVYYKLVGIDEEVLAGQGRVEPKGVLPRYTESLIGYFQELEKQLPASREIKVLKYSGVNTIKIRYKYTDSVIKKIIKLGLIDPKLLEQPLKIFLKGGALHDLIGMLFICSYPHEKEWVARTLYNFFEYDNRTDDHLLYGFYKVEKKSGYRGLHCDHTFFNPRFDAAVSGENDTISIDPNAIFTELDADDKGIDVLRKLKDYFNVEIQLHTTFENLWASMEHTNNYNIQAKGAGRNPKITVQWKLLADGMKNIENQFERLQIDTEQARFEVIHHEEYLPVKTLLDSLGSNSHQVHSDSVKKIEDLEDLLSNHEISRQDYVSQLQTLACNIDNFALTQKDLTVQSIFKIQSAFIYFGLANQREYFNTEDIRQFVKKSLRSYEGISTFLSTNPKLAKGSLLHIVTIFRYLYLAQKYGMGLMNPPKELFTYEDVPAVSYEKSLTYFKMALSLLNSLEDEEMEYFRKDNSNALKIIYQFDTFAREWELFNKDDASQNVEIAKDIQRFREQYLTPSLLAKFNTLLESDKIKNIGFVVKFYTTQVWHGFIQPIDALKQIIKYSAYDKIKASDLFYYELAAYRTFDRQKGNSLSETVSLEHSRNYHRKNMIQLLFRIKKNELMYKFHKARLDFEQLTQTRFKVDHFSENISQEDK